MISRSESKLIEPCPPSSFSKVSSGDDGSDQRHSVSPDPTFHQGTPILEPGDLMTIVSPVQWASTVLMDNSNCELHVTWSRRCCEFRYTSASDPLFEYRTLTHNPLLREMLYSLRHPLSRDVLFCFHSEVSGHRCGISQIAGGTCQKLLTKHHD